MRSDHDHMAHFETEGELVVAAFYKKNAYIFVTRFFMMQALVTHNAALVKLQ